MPHLSTMERGDPIGIARVKQLGKLAESLTLSGCSGEVLAVVSGVIYLSLSFPAREILWLAPEGAPLHRRCIAASFRLEHVEASLNFISHDGYLRIADALVIDLQRAAPWEPTTPLGSEPLPLTVVGARSQAILDYVRSLPARGLGEVLELFLPLGNGGGDRGTSSRDAIWIDRTLPTLQEIVRACQARDITMILRSGLKLVGLGLGLTPSGDDFLGGLLFTAYHLKSAYPWEFRWDRGLIPDFLDRACPLTNRLSYTILEDLAHGHGPEPLHALVNSLLRGEPSHSLDDVQRLTGIGHSSGWDMLAGVLTAMLLTRVSV